MLLGTTTTYCRFFTMFRLGRIRLFNFLADAPCNWKRCCQLPFF